MSLIHVRHPHPERRSDSDRRRRSGASPRRVGDFRRGRHFGLRSEGAPSAAKPLEDSDSGAIATGLRIPNSPGPAPVEESDLPGLRTLVILMALRGLESSEARGDPLPWPMAKPISGEDLLALARALTEGHL